MHNVIEKIHPARRLGQGAMHISRNFSAFNGKGFGLLEKIGAGETILNENLHYKLLNKPVLPKNHCKKNSPGGQRFWRGLACFSPGLLIPGGCSLGPVAGHRRLLSDCIRDTFREGDKTVSITPRIIPDLRQMVDKVIGPGRDGDFLRISLYDSSGSYQQYK